VDDFPEVSCKRCEKRNGPQYTVPLRLIPPGETAWQSLCVGGHEILSAGGQKTERWRP